MEASLIEYGPRTALHWSEIATLVMRAKAIMAECPPAPGFMGSGGERSRRLQLLADEYAITTRTLYRYLKYGPPVVVRVGPWTATFATKDVDEGAPVQVSGWIYDPAGEVHQARLFLPRRTPMATDKRGGPQLIDAAMEQAVLTRTVDTLRWAGVPERYLGARFGNWRPTPGTTAALAAARKVAEQPANLVLVGPWGCGKTRLTASVMAALVERWMDAYPTEIIEDGPEGLVTRPPFASRFAGVPQLLDAIRRSYEYDDEPDPLRPLLTAPLLILDDLGREKATDWVLERLYVLIDTRYGERRPTVVTTNYSLDELARRDYGAMVSRLTEDGSVVKTSAADQRPRAVS